RSSFHPSLTIATSGESGPFRTRLTTLPSESMPATGSGRLFGKQTWKRPGKSHPGRAAFHVKRYPQTARALPAVFRDVGGGRGGYWTHGVLKGSHRICRQ